MTGVYVYCLGDPDHPPPRDVLGIQDAPVNDRRTADFTAWVSPADRAPTASLDHVRAHNRVVEAAARVRTPVPFRFGQWFTDDAALESSLLDRRDGLLASLDRVRDCLEMGVRVVDPASTAEEPDRRSGAAYLQGLARRERQAEGARRRGVAVAEDLRAWLGPLVRDARVQPVGDATLVRVAHLVGRHDTGTYRRRMDEFADRTPELHFFQSGPWPPYGFVE